MFFVKSISFMKYHLSRFMVAVNSEQIHKILKTLLK
jgi:hypothetical protein